VAGSPFGMQAGGGAPPRHRERAKLWGAILSAATSRPRPVPPHCRNDLIADLETNRSGLVSYDIRHRRREPVSTGFLARVVNEMVVRRMARRLQTDRAACPERV
jgi:hypothetical protein